MYPSYQRSMTRVVCRVHAVSAVILALYLVPHIVNRVVGLRGVDAYIASVHAVTGHAARLAASDLTSFRKLP
jgi:succinate dehydrogenase/fumarate reductase cytochrome b subunit